MNEKPLISVIMPVFNEEKYLSHAISSILNQSFSDFELIIINDGSTDNSLNIMNSFSDSRIRIIDQNNQGISSCLNKGISESRGDFIARMDADDISRYDRLKIQYEFFKNHPDYGIVGSAVNVIDTDGKRWGKQTFISSDVGIRWLCLTQSPFVHPSVMIRKECLVNNHLAYSELKYVEDYDLWIKLLVHTKGFVIDQTLLDYRVHKFNITKIYHQIQLGNHNGIAFRSIMQEFPSIEFTQYQLDQLLSLSLASSRDVSKMHQSRTDAILFYLYLWNLFHEKYSKSADIGVLEHHVIGRIVGWILLPPFPPNFWGLIRRINNVSPHWFFYLLESMPRRLSGLIRERLVWMK